jgi:MFS family permease
LWAGFLFSLLFGLNRGPVLGWGSSPVIALFAASGLLLAAFLLRELKVSNPTIRLSLFRVWGFSAGSTASFASFMSQQASVFLMPFYLQLALSLSARTAGVLMTAVPLSMAVVAPISGRLSDRYGSRGLATAGLVLVGLGLFLLSAITTEAQGYGPIVGAFLLLGLGMGLFQSPNNSFIFGSVPREFYGVASGFIATLRNAGSSLGIALWGTIVTSQLTSHGFKGDLEATISNPGLADRVMPVFLDGMHLAMYAALAVVFIGIVASALRGSAGYSQPPPDGFPPPAKREGAGRPS